MSMSDGGNNSYQDGGVKTSEVSGNLSVQDSQINVDETWKIAFEQIQLYVAPNNFSAWFKNVMLEGIDGGIAVVTVPSEFTREWIQARHQKLIQRILRKITGADVEVVISVRENKNSSGVLASGDGVDGSAVSGTSGQVKDRYADMTISPEEAPIFNVEYTHQNLLEEAQQKAGLNPTYLYESFVVGMSNRLAHAAAAAVSDRLGSTYNPLFIWGGSGVGKTHMIQAVGNRVLNMDPNKKVLYCPSETFLNELVDAIRNDKNIEFRQKYRQLDVLIIDDIQFMSKWDLAQDELFHTFNTLYQSGKQIVFASDRTPKEIEGVEDRMRSRFEGGMVADISAPDYELRMAIVKKKAEEQRVALPDYLLELIAKTFEKNIRELEGALMKLGSHVKVSGVVPTESETLKILHVDPESKRRRISPREVVRLVCKEFGVSVRDIRGKRRTADVVAPRQVCMYLLRKELGLPLETVAKELNRRDHTTVMHAVERVEDRMETDEEFRYRVEGVEV